MFKKPAAINIQTWLRYSRAELEKAGIETAKLDSEVLLARTLNVDRSVLHTHPERILDHKTLKKLEKKLKKRIKRIPIAYIHRKKEFYGRDFVVNKNVLIPRPDSEIIIDIIKDLDYSQFPTAKPSLIDIGSGSGCLGITAALEVPYLNVTLTDVSKKALKIARKNAKSYKKSIIVKHSDLLSNVQEQHDIIVANLPYLSDNWPLAPELNFEPSLALTTKDKGLHLIKRLLKHHKTVTHPKSVIILEAAPVQHKLIIEYAKQHSLKCVQIIDCIIVLTPEPQV